MIFLDTSFIFAYYNSDDLHHKRAVAIMEDLEKRKRGQFMISDYVFSEIVTLLMLRLKNFERAITCGKDLRYFTEMLRVEGDTFEHAWLLFKEQKETLLSFTDCTNIALMKQHRIGEIVTFDKDFEKVADISVLS